MQFESPLTGKGNQRAPQAAESADPNADLKDLSTSELTALIKSLEIQVQIHRLSADNDSHREITHRLEAAQAILTERTGAKE
jgi:hypothetical protein